MRRGGSCQEGFVGMLDACLEKESMALAPIYSMTYRDQVFNVSIEGGPVFNDYLTGQVLDPQLVRAAWAKQLEHFEAKRVMRLKDIGEARRKTGKPPITVR